MLHYIYGVPPSLWVNVGFVAAGEAVACFAIGLPLMKLLEKRKEIFYWH
jgi:hypothetical protein